MVVETRTHSYDDHVVLELVEEMAEDLSRHYGPAQFPPQDPAAWASPVGTIVVAYCDEEAVGCGGFVRHDETTCELKRVFVRPTERRRGVARAVLHDLEAQARSFGYRRMILETGLPKLEAQDLYRSAGFGPVVCWPPHDEDPTSVCFAKTL